MCSGFPIVTLKIVFSRISFWRNKPINDFQTYIPSFTCCINLFLGVFWKDLTLPSWCEKWKFYKYALLSSDFLCIHREYLVFSIKHTGCIVIRIVPVSALQTHCFQKKAYIYILKQRSILVLLSTILFSFC